MGFLIDSNILPELQKGGRIAASKPGTPIVIRKICFSLALATTVHAADLSDTGFTGCSGDTSLAATGVEAALGVAVSDRI